MSRSELTQRERCESTEFASFVSTLPPDEIWAAITDVIDANDATDIKQYWRWLGLHLKSFFNDEPDPLLDAGQSEEWNTMLRAWGNYYIQTSNLIFQAERFLKLEVKEQGRDYPFKQRSELLTRLAIEHCLTYVLRYLEDSWQSPSATKQRDEIRDYVLARRRNKLSDQQSSPRTERWKEARASLYEGMRYRPVTQWNSFCVKVFDKYKAELPGYSAYLDAIDQLRKLPTMKYSIHDGKIHRYPGRGKGKTKS